MNQNINKSFGLKKFGDSIKSLILIHILVVVQKVQSFSKKNLSSEYTSMSGRHEYTSMSGRRVFSGSKFQFNVNNIEFCVFISVFIKKSDQFKFSCTCGQLKTLNSILCVNLPCKYFKHKYLTRFRYFKYSMTCLFLSNKTEFKWIS